MAEATDYLEDAIAEHITGKTTFGAVTAFVGLATAAATPESGTVTEVTDAGAYARKALSGLMGTSSNGVIANTSAVTFTTASAAWPGPLTHAFLCDSGTHGGGNILAVTVLDDQTKTVGNGDTFEFAIGDLTFTVT